jgi:uncharacterized protein YlxW (UPF0749 family)
MTPGTHERPGPRRRWRFATPLVAVSCGALFAVSAVNSEGTDLRGGRLTDFASVVKAERDTTTELTREVAELDAEIDALTVRLGDRSVSRLQEEIDVLMDPAGFTPQSGPALRVTLTDGTPETRAAYEGNKNDLVVHQQDIQAVANAMWAAGARAVTIQGQRIISTTGIKCEGNNVTLHGVPYTPPYVIVGIGPIDEMYLQLEADPFLQEYRTYTEIEGGVGWEVEEIGLATAPPYTGLTDLNWARPIDG